jgi:quercetin dioxygenase-like cupin family protein
MMTPITDPLTIRRLICDFEAKMHVAVFNQQITDENADYVIKHHFTPGVYAREMHIPAGHIVVGKIHRHEHLNFLSKGHVTVLTEAGGIEELHAGETLTSPAGVKRLLITHEDTIWTVIHATEETDLGKVEEAVIAKDYRDFFHLPTTATLTEIRKDYQQVLIETGKSHEWVLTASQNTEDQVSQPELFGSFAVAPSEIDGMGIFLRRAFKRTQVIGKARVDGKRTLLGRYVNHSPVPNAKYVVGEEGDLYVIALRDLVPDEELLYDYRQGAALSGIVLKGEQLCLGE